MWGVEIDHPTPLRPSYAGLDDPSYVNTTFQQGWNQIIIRYTRDASTPPFAAYTTYATLSMHQGLVDLVWTRAPWEDSEQHDQEIEGEHGSLQQE